MFHLADGLCFERDECGNVRVTWPREGKSDGFILATPHAWAGVVSAVSAKGEAAYEAARRLHHDTAPRDLAKVGRKRSVIG